MHPSTSPKMYTSATSSKRRPAAGWPSHVPVCVPKQVNWPTTVRPVSLTTKEHMLQCDRQGGCRAPAVVRVDKTEREPAPGYGESDGTGSLTGPTSPAV
jgi:hypothetical protein